MPSVRHAIQLRVRYSETDQMGSYYNSRALEWFECGRSELLRSLGKSYRQIESEGMFMPLSEAYVKFLGRAAYDDLLCVTSVLSMAGRARFRFDVEVQQAGSGEVVCRGHTVHAVIDGSGKPIRPPRWLVELIEEAAR